ncbi:TetR/AcrR family transcriptional regulator [Phytomonospora sp. NPDC050363]|uniref:TetR/AcrR family transcriptional regulator n=1 Tax=Phytomonospora sp. NPDC050363 TaxID=3155642 RepID=UPI0033F4F737
MPSTVAPVQEMQTRERIVCTAARLMQRQGYEGTGIKLIAREAKATLGSVYHFFPGGKKELALTAIAFSEKEFGDLLASSLATENDPGAAMQACANTLAEYLAADGWADGCPVTATALETLDDPDMRAACEHAFAHWRGIVSEALVAGGVGEQDAQDLAYTVISVLEGAELTAQVARSPKALEVAGRHLVRLLGTYR